MISADEKIYKFVITTSNLTGNLGGVAMTVTLARGLLKIYPSSEVFLVCKHFSREHLAKRDLYFPKDPRVKLIGTSQSYLTLVLLPMAWMFRLFGLFKSNRVLKHFIEADYILDTGGITFSDELGFSGMVVNSTLVLIARLLGKPNIKVSQAYGPFRNPLHAWISRKMLAQVDLLISRGSESSRALRNLNINNYKECADLSFLATPANTAKVKEIIRFKNDLILGVSPNTVLADKFRKKELFDVLIQTFETLFEKYRNLKIWLICNAFRVQKTTDNNDKWLLEEFFSLCQKNPKISDKIQLIMGDYTPFEMMEIIGKTDVFLACRFHSQVFALSMGVPTIALGWADKYLDVQKQFGLDLHLHYSELTKISLQRKIEKAIRNLREIKQMIKKRLPLIQNSARKNFQYIRGFIQEHEKDHTKK